MNQESSSTPLLRCRTELTEGDQTLLALAKSALKIERPLTESEIMAFAPYVTPEVLDHVLEFYHA